MMKRYTENIYIIQTRDQTYASVYAHPLLVSRGNTSNMITCSKTKEILCDRAMMVC